MTAESSRPRVTIAITSYNYARFVGAAIESALAQDYEPLEVLVLDNASTDDSAEVISRYTSDPRIRYVRHSENIGLVANHNAAISLASGEYITFLSADDILLPGAISDAMAFYQRMPDIDVSYGVYYNMDESGVLSERFQAPGIPQVESYCDRNEFVGLLEHDNYICLPTILIRRQLLVEHGGLDDHFAVASDYDLYLRWARLGLRFAFRNSAVAAIRRHGDSRSWDRYTSSGLQLREHVDILERYVSEDADSILAGRGAALRSMLDAKIGNLRRHPEQFDSTWADLQPRVESLYERLEKLDSLGNRGQASSPAVSVIVPSIGDMTALARTITSIARQTFTDFEVVVVQDGGASNEHAVYRMSRNKLRYARRIYREGAWAARNTALELARGKYIAYLDEGDEWVPDHLALCFRQLNLGCDIVYTGATIEHIDAVGRTYVDGQSFASSEKAWPVRAGLTVSLGSVVHRRECLTKAGKFGRIPILEDWDFLFRLGLWFKAEAIAAQTHVMHMGELGVLRNNIPSYGGMLAYLFSIYANYTNASDKQRQNELLSRIQAIPNSEPTMLVSTLASSK